MSLISRVVVIGALFALAPAAIAQTHVGSAQALRIKAQVLNLVDVGVMSTVAGPQPSGGNDFAVGPQVRAGSVSTLGLNALNLVPGVCNFLSVDASALTATSEGGNGRVFSSASVATVGVNEAETNLTLRLSVPLVAFSQPTVNLSSFLSVRALRTETLAQVSGLRTSRTIIEGLSVRNGNGGFVTVSSALLGTGATGMTALDGSVNLTFEEDDAPVTLSAVVAGFGVTNELASIVLHEKINNQDGSRTTNGIHVTLQGAALTGPLLGTNVVIASSTAGVNAPEPGTFSLLALALGASIGAKARRRRTGAGIMHSKPVRSVQNETWNG